MQLAYFHLSVYCFAKIPGNMTIHRWDDIFLQLSNCL